MENVFNLSLEGGTILSGWQKAAFCRPSPPKYGDSGINPFLLGTTSGDSQPPTLNFGASSEHSVCVGCSSSSPYTMDVDAFFQSMPSADTWEKLWDAADDGEGLGASFESSLVDNLLVITKNDSIEQDSPITCDRCKKVSLYISCD